MKRKSLIIISLFLISQMAFSQFTVSGKLVDQQSNKAVAFAHIIQEDSSKGSTSNESGEFVIRLAKQKGALHIQALGYKPESIFYKVSHGKLHLGSVFLSPQAYTLDEITVTSGLVTNSQSPVTVSTVGAKTIRTQLGDLPLPLILQNTPGVYSIRNGGGSGDAEMSIRGFSQENVSILLNGIPINGMENGLVYWSNWLGLSDAAVEIQVQKGPGVANMATNAVGGSVNIITEPAKKEKGGALVYQLTSYGNQKFSLALNSGKMKNGWSVSFLGSHTRGPGYIDATYVSGWSYFLALSKQINPKNKLTISLLGAPQRHGQRTLKLSNEEHELRGNLFNKDWGTYKGQINNASENFYHKPFLSVNHYLRLGENKKLANSIYVSYGSGGGKWSESFNYAPSIFAYRDPSVQIDWPAIYQNNASHEGQYELENGEVVNGYSLNVQTNFLASHIQAGFLSTYEQELSPHLKLVAGFHYRYLNSFLREEISDLLGGGFFIEDYGWAVDGVAGRPQIKTTGDIIKVNNNSIIHFVNAYAQLLYSSKKTQAYFSVNGNNNLYRRIDRYNYVSNTESERIIRPGFDVRGGFSFLPGIRHTLFINGAFISKAPYFKFVFGNFTNVPVQNLKNENVQTVEVGYRLKKPKLETKINAYYTFWNNVSLLSNEYVQLENNTQTRAMVNGLNAIHKGIEGEVKYMLNNQIQFGGIFSLGNYRWQNNVEAQLFNNNNVAVDTLKVFAKGLFVGGTAQQQFGLSGNFRFFRFVSLRVEWLVYNNLYASFNPTQRNKPDDRPQAFRIPSYNLLNLYLSIPFKIGRTSALVQLSGYNLLNSIHILNGEDGEGHDRDTFRGFWSFGRNFNLTLKIGF
ncbi:MAG: TonB-dependent receptor [Bacteroidales bacterium]|nr:TonB-dependent receptor [Bacteroidales bacterium]